MGSAIKPLNDDQKRWLQNRGIERETWSALTNSVFPGAKFESVAMYHDYCVARKLDPLKKPAHIVPMPVNNPQTGKSEWRDVIMAGIYEHRTTAMRTGAYAGQDDVEFGPTVEIQFGNQKVSAPEWAKCTVYRIVNGHRCAFTEKVYFEETAATKKDGSLNAMWTKRKRGQLAKCAEAGALRKGFPEELGGQQTIEEMEGREPIDVTPAPEQKTSEVIEAAAAIESHSEELSDVEQVIKKLSSATDRAELDLILADAGGYELSGDELERVTAVHADRVNELTETE